MRGRNFFKFLIVCVLFSSAAPANVTACQHFIARWTLHNGGLPDMTSFPSGSIGVDGVVQIGGFSRTWTVSQNYSGQVFTASGESRCGTSSANPPAAHSTAETAINCWCRMTAPYTGAWILSDTVGSSHCDRNCSLMCVRCIQRGYAFAGNPMIIGPCVRSALLAN